MSLDLISFGEDSNIIKVYPERLLIYHAGTAQNAWLGSVKITSIIMFALFSGFLAPNFNASDDVPKWVPAACKSTLLQVNNGYVPFQGFNSTTSKSNIC